MSKRKPKPAAVAAPEAKGTRALTKQESEAMPKPSKALKIVYDEGGDHLRKLSEVYQDPALKAALLGNGLLAPWSGDLDLMGSIRALKDSIAEVQAGDMRQADVMLVAQATTLDTLFTVLVNKAMANSTAGYFNAAEGYMRLALKAQSQARTSWESLSKIKNPVGATFIRQANMANGPQQVNNGISDSTTPASAPASVREIESQPNEILGGAYRGMDSRAPTAAVGGDTQVGAVAQSDRTENGGG